MRTANTLSSHFCHLVLIYRHFAIKKHLKEIQVALLTWLLRKIFLFERFKALP